MFSMINDGYGITWRDFGRILTIPLDSVKSTDSLMENSMKFSFPLENHKGNDARFCTLTILNTEKNVALADYLLPEDLAFLGEKTIEKVFSSPQESHSVILLAAKGEGETKIFQATLPSIPQTESQMVDRINHFSRRISTEH